MKDVPSYSFEDNAHLCEGSIIKENQLSHQQVGSTCSWRILVSSKYLSCYVTTT